MTRRRSKRSDRRPRATTRRRSKRSDRRPRATAQVYQHPGHPGHLLARERRWLVMWPAVADGWSQRRPYTDDEAGLIPVDLSAAIGTGWHMARRTRPGRVPRDGVPASQSRTVRLTPDELAADHAARGQLTWAEWDRQARAAARQQPSHPTQAKNARAQGNEDRIPDGARYECEECGEYVTRGQGTCWETGAAH